MNDLTFIGTIVSTHGIRGELRILSDFPFKDRVFMVGHTLVIDQKEYKIRSYRVHKKFEMIIKILMKYYFY